MVMGLLCFRLANFVSWSSKFHADDMFLFVDHQSHESHSVVTSRRGVALCLPRDVLISVGQTDVSAQEDLSRRDLALVRKRASPRGKTGKPSKKNG